MIDQKMIQDVLRVNKKVLDNYTEALRTGEDVIWYKSQVIFFRRLYKSLFLKDSGCDVLDGVAKLDNEELESWIQNCYPLIKDIS